MKTKKLFEKGWATVQQVQNLIAAATFSGGSGGGAGYLGNWDASTNTPTLPDVPTSPPYSVGQFLINTGPEGVFQGITYPTGSRIIVNSNGADFIWGVGNPLPTLVPAGAVNSLQFNLDNVNLGGAVNSSVNPSTGAVTLVSLALGTNGLDLNNSGPVDFFNSNNSSRWSIANGSSINGVSTGSFTGASSYFFDNPISAKDLTITNVKNAVILATDADGKIIAGTPPTGIPGGAVGAIQFNLNGTDFGGAGSYDLGSDTFSLTNISATNINEAILFPVAGSIAGGPYFQFQNNGNLEVSSGRGINFSDGGNTAWANLSYYAVSSMDVDGKWRLAVGNGTGIIFDTDTQIDFAADLILTGEKLFYFISPTGKTASVGVTDANGNMSFGLTEPTGKYTFADGDLDIATAIQLNNGVNSARFALDPTGILELSGINSFLVSGTSIDNAGALTIANGQPIIMNAGTITLQVNADNDYLGIAGEGIEVGNVHIQSQGSMVWFNGDDTASTEFHKIGADLVASASADGSGFYLDSIFINVGTGDTNIQIKPDASIDFRNESIVGFPIRFSIDIDDPDVLNFTNFNSSTSLQIIGDGINIFGAGNFQNGATLNLWSADSTQQAVLQMANDGALNFKSALNYIFDSNIIINQGQILSFVAPSGRSGSIHVDNDVGYMNFFLDQGAYAFPDQDVLISKSLHVSGPIEADGGIDLSSNQVIDFFNSDNSARFSLYNSSTTTLVSTAFFSGAISYFFDNPISAKDLTITNVKNAVILATDADGKIIEGEAPSGLPAGDIGTVQYNANGTDFGGNSNFLWDGTAVNIYGNIFGSNIDINSGAINVNGGNSLVLRNDPGAWGMYCDLSGIAQFHSAEEYDFDADIVITGGHSLYFNTASRSGAINVDEDTGVMTFNLNDGLDAGYYYFPDQPALFSQSVQINGAIEANGGIDIGATANIDFFNSDSSARFTLSNDSSTTLVSTALLSNLDFFTIDCPIYPNAIYSSPTAIFIDNTNRLIYDPSNQVVIDFTSSLRVGIKSAAFLDFFNAANDSSFSITNNGISGQSIWDAHGAITYRFDAPVQASDLYTAGVISAISLGTDSSGKIIKTNFAIGEIPTGLVNGVNPSFTLAHSPSSGLAALYLAGTRLAPSLYSITGSTVSFLVAPVSGLMLADYPYIV